VTEGQGLKSSVDYFQTKKEAISFMSKFYPFMIKMDAYVFNLQKVTTDNDGSFIEIILTKHTILN